MEVMVPLPEGHGRPEKPVDRRVQEGWERCVGAEERGRR